MVQRWNCEGKRTYYVTELSQDRIPESRKEQTLHRDQYQRHGDQYRLISDHHTFRSG